MNKDNVVFKLIEQEQERQESGIELIASENFVCRGLARQTLLWRL